MSVDLFGGPWEVVGAGKFVDFYSEESEFVDWPGWEGVARPVGLGAMLESGNALLGVLGRGAGYKSRIWYRPHGEGFQVRVWIEAVPGGFTVFNPATKATMTCSGPWSLDEGNEREWRLR